MNRKLQKLAKNPGLFLRDALLNRYPLGLQADINRPRKQDAVKALPKNTAPSVMVAGFVEPSFQVDVVYTWVDADDPDFAAEKARWQGGASHFKPEATHESRFKSRDELRYSLRSIAQYASWIRRIYVVTNGQVPTWLDLDNEKVRLIKHSEIIPECYLPTFNSHVIESCLHRIPGLSEHYVYFNDDVLLLKPVEKRNFFTEHGLMCGFISSATIPNGPKTESDTPSMWAIKNAQALLYKMTGCFFDRKFAHTFHPQLRSIALENEERFADAFHICRGNRFRSDSDILCTSFLYPCAAYAKGQAVFAKQRAWYFNIRDVSAKNYYQALAAMKGKVSCPTSVCLNDHVNLFQPSRFDDYESYLASFLQAYFPTPAPWEVDASVSRAADLCSVA